MVNTVNNYTPKLKKAQVSRLPKGPGVYVFKKGGQVLYIGKAANLRERVKQHRELLKKVKLPSYIETGSEIEALILEANLIKKYKPKYNVLWRDDKNFFYVATTKEKLPRVFITHQIKLYPKPYTLNPGYIGPFVDGRALKQTLRYLRKTFPYYTAKKHPKNLCPWCHLDLCPGPAPDPKDYQKNIKNLIKVLKGQKSSVLRNLKKEMAKAAKSRSFEKAAKIRDQVIGLERVLTNAKVLRNQAAPQKGLWDYRRVEGYDVSNIQGKFAAGSMVTFVNGQPDKNFYRRFKIRFKSTPDDTAMLKEVLTRRFSHPEWPFPDLILIDGGKAQFNAAKLAASSFKLKAEVIALTKDKKHKGVKIYTAKKKEPTELVNLSPALRNLILRVDQEAHRFAITYHKKLRDIDLGEGL